MQLQINEIFARGRANVKYPAALNMKITFWPDVIINSGTYENKATSEQVKIRRQEGRENEGLFL